MDTTPSFPEPAQEKIDAAIRELISRLEYIPPHYCFTAHLIISAIVARGHSTAAAMWAVHQLIGMQIINPLDRREIPANTALITEADPPAGLALEPRPVFVFGGSDEYVWPNLVLVVQHSNQELMQFLYSGDEKSVVAGENTKDGHKANESVQYTLRDLLSDLTEVDWCRRMAAQMHQKAEATGKPYTINSIGAHYTLQASNFQSEGDAKATDLHSRPGVKLLKTFCLAKGKQFERAAVDEFCAALALRSGRTLDDLLLLDAENVVSQLAGTAAPMPQEKPEARTQNASTRKPRKCYRRDHLWLEWYEAKGSDTYHSPAKIRDKWNRENPATKIDTGELGRDLVEKSLAKARRERGNVPPEK